MNGRIQWMDLKELPVTGGLTKPYTGEIDACINIYSIFILVITRSGGRFSRKQNKIRHEKN